MESPKEVIRALDEAINAYEVNQAAVLQKAFDTGGALLVIDTERAYRDMLGARWEIAQKKLDTNLERYKNLSNQAKVITSDIKKSIDTLNKVKDIIKMIDAIVGLVGRILVLF